MTVRSNAANKVWHDDNNNGGREREETSFCVRENEAYDIRKANSVPCPRKLRTFMSGKYELCMDKKVLYIVMAKANIAPSICVLSFAL
jgi:hypothetical protein